MRRVELLLRIESHLPHKMKFVAWAVGKHGLDTADSAGGSGDEAGAGETGYFLGPGGSSTAAPAGAQALTQAQARPRALMQVRTLEQARLGKVGWAAALGQ